LKKVIHETTTTTIDKNGKEAKTVEKKVTEEVVTVIERPVENEKMMMEKKVIRTAGDEISATSEDDDEAQNIFDHSYEKQLSKIEENLKKNEDKIKEAEKDNSFDFKEWDGQEKKENAFNEPRVLVAERRQIEELKNPNFPVKKYILGASQLNKIEECDEEFDSQDNSYDSKSKGITSQREKQQTPSHLRRQTRSSRWVHAIGSSKEKRGLPVEAEKKEEVKENVENSQEEKVDFSVENSLVKEGMEVLDNLACIEERQNWSGKCSFMETPKQSLEDFPLTEVRLRTQLSETQLKNLPIGPAHDLFNIQGHKSSRTRDSKNVQNLFKKTNPESLQTKMSKINEKLENLKKNTEKFKSVHKRISQAGNQIQSRWVLKERADSNPQNEQLFYGVTASSKHTYVSQLSIATKEVKDIEIENEMNVNELPRTEKRMKKKNMLSLDLSNSQLDQKRFNIGRNTREHLNKTIQPKKKTISFSGRIPDKSQNLFSTPLKKQGNFLI
jgi:hypothetical protein